MKYRSKLYTAFIATALVSSSVGMGVLYWEFRPHILEDEQAKAITVAATTAALLDPNLLGQINTLADEKTPAYQQLKYQLAKARDANRRPHIFIKFLYTLKPDPQNTDQMIFLVDAEADPRETSSVGDIDHNSPISDIRHHLKDYFSPGKFLTDQWGTWISGFAPVLDKEGNYVATVGADISVDRYFANMRGLTHIMVIGFGVALAFAFFGAKLLSRRVTRSLKELLFCVREIGQGNLKTKALIETKDEFQELAEEINRMSKGLRERERLKLNFARYVSHHVMDKILKSETITKLEGERKKITVLFSDIRQFTKLSEQLPPEKVVSLLNEYFGAMLEVIFRFQGTLDKFIGDGIMVEFGAPLDDTRQEKNAVMTAIQMQKELKILTEKWEKEGKPRIEIGIGIHTGFAIVGSIGSEKRLEYTAIGDTVNVAARLENATKQLKKPILISASTYSAIEKEFKGSNLGAMELHGRTEPVTVYAIDPDDYNLKRE